MAIDPIPQGHAGLTPSITVSPCAAAIDFYKAAFGATEPEPRMTGPDGLVAHAELDICGVRIMLGDEWPDAPNVSPSSLGGRSTAAMFLYFDDIDTVWQRAVDAGAEVIYPLEVQFYGVKGGRVRDPFGHTWGLGQQVEVVDQGEMERRVQQFYKEQEA
ncbi:MAG: VOC family protein [Microthrixaceae bacterium]